MSFCIVKRWRDLRRLSKSHEKERDSQFQDSNPLLHGRYPTQYPEHHQQEASHVRSGIAERTGPRESLALRTINTF
jgi:hypothetical protein